MHGDTLSICLNCVNARYMPGKSVGSLPGDHGRNRFEHDLEIRDIAALTHVLEIEAHPFLEADMAAPCDLPETGDSRRHFETPLLPGKVLGYFGGEIGPGPDDAHFPHEHIDELRQLVEARAAQETTDAGDARIVLDLENGTVDAAQGSERPYDRSPRR